MRYVWAILILMIGVGTLFAQDEVITPEMLADPNGAFMLVNEAEIYYIAEGNPSDPAVILIHGFGGSTFTWRDNMPALVEAGFYAVALDLPPFGLSEKSAEIGYTRSDLAGYVAGLMDALDIETATIVGHSMGGEVTSYFAVEYPERVDKLVFVAGGIFNLNMGDADTGESPFAFLDQIDPTNPAAVDLLRTVLRPSVYANILDASYYTEGFVTDEIVEGYTRPLLIPDWPVGLLSYIQAFDEDPITLDQLVEQVGNMPVLFLWGAEDAVVPLILGETMEAALSNTTFVVYSETGHIPMEEALEDFNADLINFLQAE